MFVGDELAVLVTDWDSESQQIGCFAISSILSLRHTAGALNGLPHEDLTKGYDCGSVTCTPEQWRRVNRWVTRGDFATVRVTASKEYRFGFCTRQQLVNRGVTAEDFAWLNAYAESADYEYRRLIEAAKPVQETAKVDPAVKPEKREKARKPKPDRELVKAKNRRRVERWAEDWE